MKFVNFSAVLFLLSEISFNLVSGKAINLKKGKAVTEEKFVLETETALNEEKNDCTKYYNYIRGDNKIYSIDECCSEHSIKCEDGFITKIEDNGEILATPGFPYFPKLKSLKLYPFSEKSNSIQALPEELFKLTSLEYLQLCRSQIETIPPSIGNLINLKELSLTMNDIKVLPEELFKLSNLEILDLSFNKIKTISSSIGNLTNLKELHLSFNEINNFPDELCKLPNLKKLYLSDNKIETLPSTITNLEKLEEYDLERNSIKNIPEGFKLTNIERQYSREEPRDGVNTDIILDVFLVVVLILMFTGVGCCICCVCINKKDKTEKS